MRNLKIIFFVVLFSSLSNTKSQTFMYDFSTGYEGWTGDFADYPITDSLFYELTFYRTNLPLPLDTNKSSLLISGNNHSDDLFMFIKRKILGLLPNTTYGLMISVVFASNAPTNAVGVGGAPGEGVIVKAGASTIEPLKINTDGFFLMNIDKGNQIQPGSDMDTIGHVGVSDTTTVFTLINRNNSNHLFTITTDSNGEVWVCIGTDSGFEATTTLYFDQITLTFNSTTGINDNKNYITEYFLSQNYPNPFNPETTIRFTISEASFVILKIYNMLGQDVKTMVNRQKNAGTYSLLWKGDNDFGQKVASGTYIYRIIAGQNIFTKKMILLK
ncbi:MAG: T9SS type A sorting domain-containing protein [Bacteroidetes bacterium]|nr:T9SS type A sorting domain-containing protein [Bacteroidota bacterium]